MNGPEILKVSSTEETSEKSSSSTELKFKDSEITTVVNPPTIWSFLQAAPSDPVFGLIHFFLSDQCPSKVLLGVGAYRDEDGKPYVLNCVKKAE
jgi:hypothetical protein